jgi:hypothetical protein
VTILHFLQQKEKEQCITLKAMSSRCDNFAFFTTKAFTRKELLAAGC